MIGLRGSLTFDPFTDYSTIVWGKIRREIADIPSHELMVGHLPLLTNYLNNLAAKN